MTSQRRDSRSPYEPFDKTQKGRRNEKEYATVLFNDFASVQGKPKLDEYTLESIQEVDGNGKLLIHTTFQEFATCVSELKKKRGNTSEALSPKYMQKLFATPKVILGIKFDGLSIFLKGHPKNQWWEKLYDDFKFDTCVACLDRGEEIESATLGIRYHQLCEILDALIKQNKGKDMEAYAGLAIQRQACGRPSETGLMNLASANWDNGLEVAWGNRKQGRQQYITFYPDGRDFLTCPYFAYAVLLLANPGYHRNIYDKEWVFPGLADYADGGIATFLTNKIKEVVKKYNLTSVTEDHTAHGVRAGAADDMLLSNDSMDRIGVYIGAVYRGGWLSEIDCVIFRYLFSKLYVAQAGKVLAGYEHPEQDVALPSLECLPVDDRTALEHVMQRIFTENFHTKQLKPFRDCIVASYLMYHEDFVSRYGCDHIVPSAFVEICKFYDITPAAIATIGKLIAGDVREKNKANMHRVIAKKSSNGDAAVVQVKRLEALEKENGELKLKVSSVEGKLTDVQGQLSNVQGQLTGMTALMERVCSGVDMLMRVQQPVQPVQVATEPARQTAILDVPPIQPPQAHAAPTLFERMIEQSRRGHGQGSAQWNINSDKLVNMKYSEFLIERRHRMVDLGADMKQNPPFGPSVGKQARQKVKALYNATIAAAENADDPDLKNAAEEMKSNAFPPDHKRAPAEYRIWKSDIDRMALQLIKNFEESLCDDYVSSARAGSAPEAAKEKMLNKIKERFQKKCAVGSLMSFYEKDCKQWDKIVPEDEASP
jgi:hypothetical protein